MSAIPQPQTNTVPQAVIDAQAALTARIAPLFSLPELAKHSAIADAINRWTGTIDDPVSVLTARGSLRDTDNARQLAALAPYFNTQTVSQTLDANGVPVDMLAQAAKASVEWKVPHINEIDGSSIKLWRPDTTSFDPARCFAPCGQDTYSGLAIRQSGGAYGIRMDWGIEGYCMPSFLNADAALAWIKAQAIVTSQVWQNRMLSVYRTIFNKALKHKFTLQVDANDRYVLGGSPMAPSGYGIYRHAQEQFAMPTDLARFAPLSATFLNDLAYHVKSNEGFMSMPDDPTSPQVYHILDGHPNNGFLYNEYPSGSLMTAQQQFTMTGQLPTFGNSGINQSMLPPWKFVIDNGLTNPLTINAATGEFTHMRKWISLADVDPTALREAGYTLGAPSVMDPKVRNPMGAEYFIAPPKAATILTVADPYLQRALGPDNIWPRLYSPTGLRVERVRLPGQLVSIYDTQFSWAALVIPNAAAENNSIGIIAAARSLSGGTVNMCDVATVTTQLPINLPGEKCPRDKTFLGFMDTDITGPVRNDAQVNVGAYSSEASDPTVVSLNLVLRPGQTMDRYNPFNANVGQSLIVIYVDANGVNSSKVSATLYSGLQFVAPTGGGQMTMPDATIRIKLASALPAGSSIRAIMPADAAPIGSISVVKGTAEVVRDEMDAIQSGQLVVQVTEMPLWADNAVKTVTMFNAAGAATFTVTGAVVLDVPTNDPDGKGFRLRLQSADANFTLANMNAAARVTIA